MNIKEQRTEYLRLLQEEHKEQVYQTFMEKHTCFIPREFVQNHGIGCGIVLRKLAFGADYKSDFFFFSKSSDDWNAVFIELEKLSSQFFRGNTDDFHPDFLKAVQQIKQWKAWFLSDQNKGSFLSTVSAIQVPEHMANNPTYNKYVLVFGRRSQYEGNENRRRLVSANEEADFKIITFDSLMEDLSAKPKVTIGSRHNQYIDILTDEITNPSLCSWVEPTRLRVSKKLHEKLEKGPRSNHFVFVNGKAVEAFTHAAPLVRVRAD
jgi:Domain of unknown function (DUF4263)